MKLALSLAAVVAMSASLGHLVIADPSDALCEVCAVSHEGTPMAWNAPMTTTDARHLTH